MKISLAAWLTCAAALSLLACTPSRAPMSATTLSIEAESPTDLKDISGVKCRVHLGNTVSEVTLPTKINVTPGKNDTLRMECSKEGYIVESIFYGVQQPVSRDWLAKQPAKCAFINTVLLGEAFIGVPLAVLTNHWLPIVLIPVGSSLYSLHIYSLSGPIPSGYTYLRSRINVYMATPDEMKKHDSAAFNWNAQPNEPKFNCPA